MEEQKVYLALVNDDFVLSDEVIDYFNLKDIEIINHFKSLGILKLKTKQELSIDEMKYVSHLEEDAAFTIVGGSEEE